MKQIPLNLQMLNTINYYKKDGFSDFKIFEDKSIFGMKGYKGDKEVVIPIKCENQKMKKEYIKGFKRLKLHE